MWDENKAALYTLLAGIIGTMMVFGMFVSTQYSNSGTIISQITLNLFFISVIAVGALENLIKELRKKPDEHQRLKEKVRGHLPEFKDLGSLIAAIINAWGIGGILGAFVWFALQEQFQQGIWLYIGLGTLLSYVSWIVASAYTTREKFKFLDPFEYKEPKWYSLLEKTCYLLTIIYVIGVNVLFYSQ